MTLSIGTTASQGQSGTSQHVTGFSTAKSPALLLVAVFGGSSGYTTSEYTVSDTAGLTWTNQITPQSSAQEFDLYYAFSPSGVSNDTITVTNNGGGSSSWGFLVLEIDGAATSSVFDPATAGFNLASVPAPSCTTSNAEDMILVFASDPAGGTATASFTNSYTEAVSTTAWSNICAYAGIAYLIVSSAGNQTSTITFSNPNSNDFAFIIGVKAAAGGTNYNKSLTESLSLTASLSKKTELPLKESVSLTDKLAKKASLVFAESVSLIDRLTKKTIVPLAQSISLTDSLTRKTLKKLSESIPLSDSIKKQTSKALTETVALADSIRKRISIGFSETVSLIDSLVSRLFASKPFSIGYLAVQEGQMILSANEGQMTLSASEGSMTLSVQEV